MDKRLNSPSGQYNNMVSVNSSKTGLSSDKATNIKKTIEMLRQRISISPNRAMETIQKVNASHPLVISNSDLYRDTLPMTIKFDKERGSLNGTSKAGDVSNVLGTNTSIMRTERSYKSYGIGVTPPKSKESSRNNSQTRKITSTLSSNKAFPFGKSSNKMDVSSLSGDGSRILDKSLATSTKKLQHNIYMPKQTKKTANADSMMKKFNIDLSRGSSKNRSTTPNARESVKTRLISGFGEERPRVEVSLNTSSSGQAKPQTSGGNIVARLKGEGAGSVSKYRSPNGGARR